ANRRCRDVRDPRYRHGYIEFYPRSPSELTRLAQHGHRNSAANGPLAEIRSMRCGSRCDGAIDGSKLRRRHAIHDWPRTSFDAMQRRRRYWMASGSGRCTLKPTRLTLTDLEPRRLRNRLHTGIPSMTEKKLSLIGTTRSREKPAPRMSMS